MKNKYAFWIVLSIVAAFAAGLVGGIFSDRYFFERRPGRGDRGPSHPPSLKQMAKDLGLSADQQEQIRKLFEKNEAKLKELRADMHGRLKSIRAELKDEIDKVLTAEQRQKIETMIKKFAGPDKREFDERREKMSQEQKQEKD
jgi:Spy/CpxP family protein refolding chaperone